MAKGRGQAEERRPLPFKTGKAAARPREAFPIGARRLLRKPLSGVPSVLCPGPAGAFVSGRVKGRLGESRGRERRRLFWRARTLNAERDGGLCLRPFLRTCIHNRGTPDG